MKPIDFKQFTKVLQKPSTMTDNECASLHVWSDGKQCVSCWKPTIKERLNILFGGKVWLGVLSGGTQPPVFVSGSNVFNRLPLMARFRACISSMAGSIAYVIKVFVRAAKQADKQKHFVAGLFASLLAGALFGFWVGFSVGGLVGAFKEWWDSKGHGAVEIMDFVFTLLGSIAGASLSVILIRFVSSLLFSIIV